MSPCNSSVCLSLSGLVTLRISNRSLVPPSMLRSVGRQCLLNCRRASTQMLAPSVEERVAIDAKIFEQAQLKPNPIKLHDFVKFRNLKGASPPEADLLENANYVISEIKLRLARRIDAMQSLPLLVVLNPHVSEIYNTYYNSFRVMSNVCPPQTLAENDEFVAVLQQLVDSHSDTIPVLARGFSQATRIMFRENINEILDEHLRARIGTRILAEHHIGLTHPIGPNFVGCIQTDLNPAKVCQSIAQTVSNMTSIQFGYAPTIKFDLGLDVVIAYPLNHLEYIITELLKNAFHAVCRLGEHNIDKNTIVVTVVKSGQGVIIRIRDRGGGIPPENESEVFDFAYTSVERGDDEGGLMEGVDSSLAGLGYGLPLSKAYAEFFGGKLQLQSYHGWGTDAYLTLASPLVSGFHRDVN